MDKQRFLHYLESHITKARLRKEAMLNTNNEVGAAEWQAVLGELVAIRYDVEHSRYLNE